MDTPSGSYEEDGLEGAKLEMALGEEAVGSPS